MVQAEPWKKAYFPATRLDPDTPGYAGPQPQSKTTTGKRPAILPNLGGSLPNDIFRRRSRHADRLGSHSYAACSQHAPNEHLLAPVAREASKS